MKTLRLTYKTVDDKNWGITLRYPKENLTSQEIEAAMQVLLDHPIFVANPDRILRAEMIDRSATTVVG